jgi:hypothetical protein
VGEKIYGCADVLICTSLVEAFYSTILIARNYTAIIMLEIDEN